MSKKKSRKNFAQGTKVNRRNQPRSIMRGGWRL
jgi:hypothetical protein